MQATSDIRLLRNYAETGREAPFRELVQRYTDFVFAAALRQLGSPDLAADIAQSVFVDLARKAAPVSARFADHASLAGWLHRSTRFAVLNHLRDTRRRLEHERQAMEHLLTDSAPEADWDQIRPLLDEALESLEDADREAVLLRYFKDQDLQTVGVALGVSDDAAQKRVTRAVERLRLFFAKRRITLQSGTLVALLSAHAVQAAPAGLVAAIASAAVTGAKLTTSAAAGAVVATATQKCLLVGLVTASLLTPVLVQQHTQSTLAAQQQLLQRQGALLTALQTDNERMAARLALLSRPSSLPPGEMHELLRLRGLVGRLRLEVRDLEQQATAGASLATNVLAAAQVVWSEQAARLKDWLETNAEGKTPELRFLNDQDWLDAIYPIALDSPDDFRRAMGNVRANAELRALDLLHGALRRYTTDHGGRFPSEPAQLVPYLTAPLEEAIFRRYQVANANSLVPELQSGDEWVITQKAPVDPDWDTRLTIGLHGGGMADSRVTNRWQLNP